MEAAQQLLAEGQALPVDETLVSALREKLEEVQDWEMKLEEVGQRQVGSCATPWILRFDTLKVSSN